MSPRNDDTFEEGGWPMQLVHGTASDAADDAALAAFLDQLHRLGEGPPPAPSAELAALLGGATPLASRTRPAVRLRWAGVAAAAVLASLTGLAASHSLPSPAQRLVSVVVNQLTPFHLDGPAPSGSRDIAPHRPTTGPGSTSPSRPPAVLPPITEDEGSASDVEGSGSGDDGVIDTPTRTAPAPTTTGRASGGAGAGASGAGGSDTGGSDSGSSDSGSSDGGSSGSGSSDSGSSDSGSSDGGSSGSGSSGGGSSGGGSDDGPVLTSAPQPTATTSPNPGSTGGGDGPGGDD